MPETRLYYAASDVSVLPSKKDMYGLVAAEALMCGTPTIITRCCGIVDLVNETRCGYVVREDDISELADTVVYVLQNRIEAREKARRGKHYLADTLSWQNIAEQFEDVYRLSPKRSRNESRRLGAVGVVTFPLVSAGLTPLLHMTDTVYPITDGMVVITGGAGSALLAHRTYDQCVVDSVDHRESGSTVMRVLHFTATQFKIISKIVRRAKSVSFWLFYQGGDHLLLPMVVARLSKKPIVLVLAGSQINTMSAKKDPLMMPARWLVETTMRLADRIAVFSPRLVEEWNLGKVADRLVFLHQQVGFDEVSVIAKPLVDRESIIGYVGRFSEEKGPLEFVESISLMSRSRAGREVFI